MRKSNQVNQVMKIRSKQINGIIICLSIVSLYSIIAIRVFPSIRIPSTFPKDIMDALNDIILDFSVAFLSGGVIYLLTVVVRDFIRRTQQKWLVYDSVKEINDKIQPILEVCEVDRAPSLDVIIGSLKDKKSSAKIINDMQSIRKAIRHDVLSCIIWSDYEIDCLMDIDNICAGIIEALRHQGCQEKLLRVVAEKILELYKQSTELNNYVVDRINK